MTIDWLTTLQEVSSIVENRRRDIIESVRVRRDDKRKVLKDQIEAITDEKKKLEKVSLMNRLSFFFYNEWSSVEEQYSISPCNEKSLFVWEISETIQSFQFPGTRKLSIGRAVDGSSTEVDGVELG